MRFTAFAVSLVFALGACSPTPSAGSTQSAVLYLENRGGPAYTVRIGGHDVATVACNSGAALTPEEDEVPQLPWDLTIVRVGSGSTLVAERVSELPRWFVQIGADPLGGLGTRPVAGPAGPSCPPAS